MRQRFVLPVAIALAVVMSVAAAPGRAHDDGIVTAHNDAGERGGSYMHHGGMMGPGTMGSGMMGSGMMGPGMMMGPGTTMPRGAGPGAMMGRQMGPGMMYEGMGPGMMMGPGWMHPSMGSLFGRRVVPPLHLSVADVRGYLEGQLEHLGNKRLKVGEVKAEGETIIADVVTVDDSLVQRLKVDRQTGAIDYEN